jgi:hypothetical protein
MIYGIRIRAGLYIDSIQVFYQTSAGPRPDEQHGGNGGIEYFLNLNQNEYITKIGIRYGRFIDQLQIHTNFRTSTYGGPGGSTLIEIVPPKSGYKIIGFHGRSGVLLDALGIISAPH